MSFQYSLQLFLEAALDAMVLVDASGIVVEVNSAACRLFACCREELIGQAIADFTPPELIAVLKQPHQNSPERLTGKVWVQFPELSGRAMEYALTVNSGAACRGATHQCLQIHTRQRNHYDSGASCKKIRPESTIARTEESCESTFRTEPSKSCYGICEPRLKLSHAICQ